MAEILVRNLDMRVVEALDARASRHGRDLETEVRVILERAAAERFVEIAEARAWADQIRRDLAGRTFRDAAPRAGEGPRTVSGLASQSQADPAAP